MNVENDNTYKINIFKKFIYVKVMFNNIAKVERKKN